MGRTYAGILGYLAAIVVLIRGLRYGAEAGSTLWAVAMAVLLFSTLGYILGEIAGATVADSVRGRMAAELNRRESQPPQEAA